MVNRSLKQSLVWSEMKKLESLQLGRSETTTELRDNFILFNELKLIGRLIYKTADKGGFIRSEGSRDSSGGSLLFRYASPAFEKQIPPSILKRAQPNRIKGIQFSWGKVTEDDIHTLFDLVKNVILQTIPHSTTHSSKSTEMIASKQAPLKVTLGLENSDKLQQIPGPLTTANGADFGSPEKNLAVENAAICFVTQYYQSEGWVVTSVESEKIGYDLLCRKDDQEEHVEVKGISGSCLSFILTANEAYKAKTDPMFHLFAIVKALSEKPELHRFSGENIFRVFHLDPICYHVCLKGGM